MAETDLITKALGWLEDAGQIAAGWLCRLRLVPVIVRVLPLAEGKAGVIATAAVLRCISCRCCCR